MTQLEIPPALPIIHDQAYRIALVSSAPVDEEVVLGKLLVGGAGRELDSQLRIAGIMRGACFATTVFNTRLPNDKVDDWCMTKAEQSKLLRTAKKEDPLTYGQWMATVAGFEEIATAGVERGKYLHPERWGHLRRLHDELAAYRPNLIVPLGNIALWAICGETGIDSRRGAITTSVLLPGVKVLPTYHPAFILSAYDKRHVAIADFMRARREGEFPDIRLTPRELWLEPTITDLIYFKAAYLDPAPLIAFDIETTRRGSGQIECISFAPSPNRGIIVPFIDWRQPSRSYWPTADAELFAWEWVREILESPKAKLAQNGTYDVQWLAEKAGIETKNYSEDTRLKHHALYPELPKDLGFLGSIYESEGAWKLLRKHKAEKRDE